MRIGEIYRRGVIYFNNGDFLNARKCFNATKRDSKYQASSLLRLCLIAEKESNYQEMREIINRGLFTNEELMGKLNLLEYNYEASLENFLKCLEKSPTKNLFLKIASLYTNLGDYSKALAIYDKLLQNPDSYYTTMMRLSHFYLFLHDYDRALAVIHQIDQTKLNNPQIVNDYKMNEAIVLAMLGQDISGWIQNTYVINQIIKQKDSELLEHLNQYRLDHKSNHSLKRGSYFYNDLDLSNLLSIMREELPNINPTIYGNMDIYPIRLGYAIGEFEGKPVTDLLVKTVTGTNIIISAHPLVLSAAFNQEGYQKNKDLKLKRDQKC